MKAFGLTDTGKVRKNNQDTFFCGIEGDGTQAVFVVCDGMGGAAAGNVASDIATAVFKDHVLKHIRPSMSAKYMESILRNAINFANYETYQTALSSREYSGMGTTLVGGFINGENMKIANVGDSRAYLITDEGIERLTIDHSVVEEMIMRGEITEEEAKEHPHRNLITRALGTDERVKSDIYSCKIEEGQTVLLCSDGLSNIVSGDEMLEIIRSVPDIEQACHQLVSLANERGGYDNITAVLVRA